MRNLSMAALLLVFALLIATPCTFGEKSRPSLKSPKSKSDKKDKTDGEETSLEKMVFENIPEDFQLQMRWPFYSKKLGKAVNVWYVPRQEYFIDANTNATIDGTYYIVTERNFLCSLSENGALQWATGLKFRLAHKPSVTAFALYVTHLSRVISIDRRNGKVLWNKDFNLAFCTAPYVTPTTVYMGTFNKLVVAIDRIEGRIKWTYGLSGDIVTAPVDSFSPMPADYIFVPSLDNYLYALDNTGALLWKFKTYGRLMSSPVVTTIDENNKYVYFGSQDTNMYCINSISSQKMWEYRSGAPILESPVVVKDFLFFRNRDNSFFCLDKVAGELKWKDEKIHSVVGVSVGSDVFMLSGENTVHAVNPKTGTKRWTCELKNFVKFVDNPDDGNVVGLTKNGIVIVFKEAVK